MESSYEFDAVIQEGRGGGAWVEFPYDAREEFGGVGRVKVKVSFDGVPYRGSLVPMGGGSHIVGIRKEIRNKIGKTLGDPVHVVLSRDMEERVVEMPEELRIAFEENTKAKAAFDKLSFSHQREHASYVGEAKKKETRAVRAKKTVQRLLGA